MKKLLFVFLLGVAVRVSAGGIMPINGWYFDPERPGTGFNLEIQRGEFSPDGWVFMAGYLYDENGKPTFITLQGAYQPSTWEQFRDADGALIGKLVSEAYVSSGGQCVGCVYTAPSTSPDSNLGPVVVEFTDLTRLRVRFQNDTWEMRLMDWHDQTNLFDNYDLDSDFIRSARWRMEGMAYYNERYGHRYFGFVVDEDDTANFRSLGPSIQAAYARQDEYDLVNIERWMTISADICNINESYDWFDPSFRDFLYPADRETMRNRCYLWGSQLSSFLYIVLFPREDGSWWFSTNSMTGLFAPEVVDDKKVRYGGVVGRALISRNEILLVGLYDEAEFMAEEFGYQIVENTRSLKPKEKHIRKTYIRLTQKNRLYRYEESRDEFWNTGSAFGEPWSGYKAHEQK